MTTVIALKGGSLVKWTKVDTDPRPSVMLARIDNIYLGYLKEVLHAFSEPDTSSSSAIDHRTGSLAEPLAPSVTTI